LIGIFKKNGHLTNNKKLPITPAKPQAVTQAITPSFRPRPSYPLAEMRKEHILTFLQSDTFFVHQILNGYLLIEV